MAEFDCLEWNRLPLEIKEMIVRRSTKNTRNALRACSWESRELVERIKINSIYRLIIGAHAQPTAAGTYYIKVEKYKPFDPYTRNFANFQELQHGLMGLLKGVNCIRTLKVLNLSSEVPLQLIANRQETPTMSVEFLQIEEENGAQIESLLSQLEHGYLRKIRLKHDGGNHKIYDLPQVIHAEVLYFAGDNSCIKEDQLLKLKTRDISFWSLSCPLWEFVKKCALEGTNFPIFSFGVSEAVTKLRKYHPHLNHNKMTMKTPYEPLSLELTFDKPRNSDNYSVEGMIRYDSERTASFLSQRDPSLLRAVHNLCLRFNTVTRFWTIEIFRKNISECIYKAAHIHQFQEKLDEILDNTDFIDVLEVFFEESREPIIWRERKTLLMVSNIDVKGDSLITAALELFMRIDPAFVKSVAIHANGEGRPYFQLPHVTQATRVVLEGDYLRNEHLLKMNAEYFSNPSTSNRGRYNKYITANGLNQYLKKCFRSLNQKRHHFKLCHASQLTRESEIFRDLRVIRREEVNGSKKFFLEVDGSNFDFQVEITSDSRVIGKRISDRINRAP